MGAQQSSGRGDVPGTPQVAKTCYYDLLGVERLATDDEYEFCQLGIPLHSLPMITKTTPGSSERTAEKLSSSTLTATLVMSRLPRNASPKSSPPTKYYLILKSVLGTTLIVMPSSAAKMDTIPMASLPLSAMCA